MSMLKLEDLKVLARLRHADAVIIQDKWDSLTTPVGGLYEGEVVPKQRPRKGKNGRMFTPPETRKFEAAVAAWGKEIFTPVAYPIRAELIIYDNTPDIDLRTDSRAGLVYDQKKDLDNMQKSIFDGLNGVAYKDDRQLIDISVRRRYAGYSGFRLVLKRKGLSFGEYRNYVRLLRGMS